LTEKGSGGSQPGCSCGTFSKNWRPSFISGSCLLHQSVLISDGRERPPTYGMSYCRRSRFWVTGPGRPRGRSATAAYGAAAADHSRPRAAGDRLPTCRDCQESSGSGRTADTWSRRAAMYEGAGARLTFREIRPDLSSWSRDRAEQEVEAGRPAGHCGPNCMLKLC